MSAVARRDDVIAAAVRRSIDIGYDHITREDIAVAAKCSVALVSYHLGTMINMRRQIMRAAVANEVLEVIAQGLVMRDKYAMRAPEAIRALAVQSLLAP